MRDCLRESKRVRAARESERVAEKEGERLSNGREGKRREVAMDLEQKQSRSIRDLGP